MYQNKQSLTGFSAVYISNYKYSNITYIYNNTALEFNCMYFYKADEVDIFIKHIKNIQENKGCHFNDHYMHNQICYK